MLKKKKKFVKPHQLYDSERIKEENKLKAKYGLKNKKEIWKAESKVKYFRTRAKNLITAEQEEQQKFFSKLNALGLKIETVSDVLALNKEDLLKRRLPSVLVEKNLANTPKQARQMVSHKRVLIKGKVVNIPSYLVRIDEESSISLRKKIRKPKVEEKKEESPAEENAQDNAEEKTDTQQEVVKEVAINA